MSKKECLLILTCIAALFLFNSCDQGRDPNELLTMDNGYQYRHYIQNEGPKPQVGEFAYYYFITKADDSLMMNGRDASMISKMEIPNLPANRKVRSPTLGMLKLMAIGDSARLIVPYDSLPEMPPSFGKYGNLYYDLVLIDIKSKAEHNKLEREEERRNKKYMKKIADFSDTLSQNYLDGLLDDKIIEKPSGLKYIIHEEGQGSIPVEGDIVQLRYYAKLVNGDMFDSNLDKSYSLPVKVGADEIRVVEGWKEALTYLKRGTKATLFIPYPLGYGENGAPGFIPPKAELAYYIELIK